MILKRLKLVNYAGIYNGMGINEIEIDFTKCKNHIILIRGDNGSGKSTLVKSIKPLPDTNDDFINGLVATKEIEYIDEFGTIYSIRFIHEIKSNGERATTKGYIAKISNGFSTQLNPNGNITSCKEIIYEEFKLDPNYVALFQLSSMNRGLADMRPSERKKYVNCILSSTEAYNNINKKLSKKSIGYKSLMSSIVAKLNSIEDSDKLGIRITDLENQISNIQSNLDIAIEDKASAQGAILALDPSGTIINEIDSINRNIESLKSAIFSISSRIEDGVSITKVKNMIDSISIKINELLSSKMVYNNNINILLKSRETEANEIQIKSAKLTNLNQGTSYTQLKEIINKCNERMSIIRKRFKNVININDITRDEFVTALHSLMDIKESIIDYMGNSEYRYDLFKNVVDNTIQDSLLEIQKINNLISSYTEELENCRQELSSLQTKREIVSELINRPKECKLDTCPYIKKAVEISKNFQESDINRIINRISELEQLIQNLKIKLEEVEIYRKAEMFLTNINRRIWNLKNILSKLPIKNMLYNTDSFVKSICDNGIVKEIDLLYSYVNEADDIEEYKVLESESDKAKTQLNSLQSQADFIELLENDIRRIQQQMDKDIEEITNLQNNILSIDTEIEKLNIDLDKYNNLYNTLLELDKMKTQQKSCEENLSKYKDIIDKLEMHKKKIIECNDKIKQLEPMLKNLKEEKEYIRYQINLINQYHIELQEYKNMYEKIEVLKYHSSTTTGIQLLFSEMYLEKTRVLANKMLSCLFGGKFIFTPFVITESDFSMPVAVNGGINHADVSSMSCAEITLLSMILSISLLGQTSSKLNIIIGDEIDGPFDMDNRREFFNILYQLMNIVQAQQCILISHNSELEQTDCDTILLRSKDVNLNQGNVIWNYYNQ